LAANCARKSPRRSRGRWTKDYVYQAEFKVLYKKVWLDK